MEAEFSGWFHYVVVRESITPTQLQIQGMHASRDSGALFVHCELAKMAQEKGVTLFAAARTLTPLPFPPGDTRIGFLVATKARMEKLIKDLDAAGIPYIQNKEDAGDLKNMGCTSISFMTKDKAAVEPIVGHLPKARLMKVQEPQPETANG